MHGSIGSDELLVVLGCRREFPELIPGSCSPTHVLKPPPVRSTVPPLPGGGQGGRARLWKWPPKSSETPRTARCLGCRIEGIIERRAAPPPPPPGRGGAVRCTGSIGGDELIGGASDAGGSSPEPTPGSRSPTRATKPPVRSTVPPLRGGGQGGAGTSLEMPPKSSEAPRTARCLGCRIGGIVERRAAPPNPPLTGGEPCVARDVLGVTNCWWCSDAGGSCRN